MILDTMTRDTAIQDRVTRDNSIQDKVIQGVVDTAIQETETLKDLRTTDTLTTLATEVPTPDTWTRVVTWITVATTSEGIDCKQIVKFIIKT